MVPEKTNLSPDVPLITSCLNIRTITKFSLENVTHLSYLIDNEASWVHNAIRFGSPEALIPLILKIPKEHVRAVIILNDPKKPFEYLGAKWLWGGSFKARQIILTSVQTKNQKVQKIVYTDDEFYRIIGAIYQLFLQHDLIEENRPFINKITGVLSKELKGLEGYDYQKIVHIPYSFLYLDSLDLAQKVVNENFFIKMQMVNFVQIVTKLFAEYALMNQFIIEAKEMLFNQSKIRALFRKVIENKGANPVLFNSIIEESARLRPWIQKTQGYLKKTKKDIEQIQKFAERIFQVTPSEKSNQEGYGTKTVSVDSILLNQGALILSEDGDKNSALIKRIREFYSALADITADHGLFFRKQELVLTVLLDLLKAIINCSKQIKVIPQDLEGE